MIVDPLSEAGAGPVGEVTPTTCGTNLHYNHLFQLWWVGPLCWPVPLPFKLKSASVGGGGTLASNTNKSPPFLPKRTWSHRKSTLHVLGKVNKIKCTWVLDTGSDVTFVSSRLLGVGKWKLTPPQSVPTTANGSLLQCLGEITASIEIGHVSKTNIRLLVIKNLNTPAILGMDTLEQFGSFCIDWTNKTLTLGEAKLVLEKHSHGSVFSPVVVSLILNHTIPPRSQCFVLAGSSDVSTHDQDVLFSPFNDKLQ